MADDKKQPSLDPLEGIGENAKVATDEFIARQKIKLEEEKSGE